jgi:predicted ester cyclase
MTVGDLDLDTLYCRFIDSVVNHRRLDHLDQFLAADVVEHAPARRVGLAAARQGLADWLTAFPDLHLVIEDLVTGGDRLMAQLTATGTHRGPLAGLAGSHGDAGVATATLALTGRRVRVPVFEAWRVPDGRCVERWLHLDTWALLQQLGRPHSRSPLQPGRRG